MRKQHETFSQDLRGINSQVLAASEVREIWDMASGDLSLGDLAPHPICLQRDLARSRFTYTELRLLRETRDPKSPMVRNPSLGFQEGKGGTK